MDRKFIKDTLPNGLKLFFVPMKGIDHVFIQIYVGCGNIIETKTDMFEVAHFLEHMQGAYTSTKHPKSKQVRKWMQDTGSVMNAATYREMTLYYTICLQKYFYKILELQLQSFTDFVLDKTVFDSERNSVVEELQSNFMNWTWIDIYEKSLKILFDIPSLHSTTSEQIESVKKIKPEDVIRFRNKYYKPSNMMIAIAGDFDFDKTKQMIKKFFSFESSTLTIDPRKVFPLTFKGPQLLYVPNKKVDNTRVEFTWVLPNTITPSDIYTSEILMLINILMSRGLDSRLLRILRTQKELVYFVSMTKSLEYNGTSTLEIATETSPKNIKIVINTIRSEINKLKSTLITTSELDRLKNKFVLENVQEPTQQQPSKYIDRYAEYFFYDKPVILMKERLALIKSITKKDIKKVASMVFKDDTLLVAYSGPKKIGGIKISNKRHIVV